MKRVISASGRKRYSWKNGDTANRVAEQFQCTEAALAASNPGIDFSSLEPGAVIDLPLYAVACPTGEFYRVRVGDTYHSIAATLNVSVSLLGEWNPYVDPTRLAVGQLLCVPPVEERTVAENRDVSQAASEVVHWGDTLDTMAKRWGVSAEALIHRNPVWAIQAPLPGMRYRAP